MPIQLREGKVGGAIGRAFHLRENRNCVAIVVKEYCGHGIGREMHEDPQILHYGHAGTGMELQEGMVFTIEPMINQGRAAIRAEPDQWPVHTRDGKLSAQLEHTVAVTRTGVRVLTLRPGEKPLCMVDLCLAWRPQGQQAGLCLTRDPLVPWSARSHNEWVRIRAQQHLYRRFHTAKPAALQQIDQCEKSQEHQNHARSDRQRWNKNDDDDVQNVPVAEAGNDDFTLPAVDHDASPHHQRINGTDEHQKRLAKCVGVFGERMESEIWPTCLFNRVFDLR